jgi:hypothetical protein
MRINATGWTWKQLEPYVDMGFIVMREGDNVYLIKQ